MTPLPVSGAYIHPRRNTRAQALAFSISAANSRFSGACPSLVQRGLPFTKLKIFGGALRSYQDNNGISRLDSAVHPAPIFAGRHFIGGLHRNIVATKFRD